jgi:lipid-A-disaccharide synthase
LTEQLGSLRPNPLEQLRRDEASPILLVLPGSRRSEIGHHMAVFGETLGQLQAQGVTFEAVLPTMPHLEGAIARGLENWTVRPRIVIGEDAKRAAFRVAHAAFAKSGTVTLELALAQVPMVTAYKAGAVEAWIVRRRITSSTVILANLVIGENVIPEFIQEDCTAAKLVPALRDVLTDTPMRRQQQEAFARIDDIMSTGALSPSARAADVVIGLLR